MDGRIHIKTERAARPRAARSVGIALVLVLLYALLPFAMPRPAYADGEQKLVKEGVAVEMRVTPIAAEKGAAEGVREGEDAAVSFTITGSGTGAPLQGLRPAVWIDRRKSRIGPVKGEPEVVPCEEKVRSFLRGSLAFRPEVDLNTYYILALNEKPTISVIDPLLGYYTSKLITTVILKSPGEDWALSRDGKRLFVTMPKAGSVAVVDTALWKAVAEIDAGKNPVRIALQPDEKYLWVGNDTAAGDNAESGVTVIDVRALTAAAHIATGAGRHEIAFSDDSRYAAVSNSESGTVSVIETFTLRKVGDIAAGSRPSSLAFSKLSKSFYATGEGDGKITIFDPRTLAATALAAKPGLRTVRFSLDGRWGFVANTSENAVHIIDASTNAMLHSITVDDRPDRIVFTGAFAFIRRLGSENVSMVQLNALGKGDTLPVLTFSGGQTPPERYPNPGPADTMTRTPEGDVMLVANPVDKTIYYYMEGMISPMGTFQNYGNVPRAVLVVDRSLRETGPGSYTTVFRAPQKGVYDVAFLLDAPRLHHCFTVEVKENPALARREESPVRIEFAKIERAVTAGEPVTIRFRVTDSTTGQPKSGIRDISALSFTSPGTWQRRTLAEPRDNGVYELSVTAPRRGLYFVFLESASLNIRSNQAPSLTFHAVEKDRAPGEAHGEKGK